MFRTLSLFVGLVFFSAPLAFGADSLSPGPSPAAQKILQLSQGGVDDSVIMTFVQTQTGPLNLSAQDLGYLKAAGVSPAVIGAISAQQSRATLSSPPLTEAQLYRLFSGVVYHEGMAFDVAGGLPETMKQELESDPYARRFIVSFDGQNGTSRILVWSGLGLVVGGLLYAGISDAMNPSNITLNHTIGFSSVGAGVVSLITGNVFGAFAYQNLYDGLYQYNRDLVNRAQGGNS